MIEAKPVVDLTTALGLSRDGEGVVSTAPRFRFIKFRFPQQKIFLPEAKVQVDFHLQRQNDLSQGAPVGIFETDNEAVAKELVALVTLRKGTDADLFIHCDNK